MKKPEIARMHVALAVQDLEAAIEEFTERLGAPPVVVAGGEYALFLVGCLNLSISEIPGQAGKLRHLGFEDTTSSEFTVETDDNGFMWERFTLPQQAQEINERWPGTDWTPSPEQLPTKG
ncbi:hypothetical protein O4H66_02280 [Comamonadaceae bacterium G21597-S1]|nr:hypothetical protein [Comamonadaceae bacterium G21597-S1]